MTAAVLLVSLFAGAVSAEEKGAHRTRTIETRNEILFSGRFANCDYGYYVLLPGNVFAHYPNYPSATHGFLVTLPDTSSRREGSVEDDRFITVNPSYDSADLRSLSRVVSNELDVLGRRGREPRTLNNEQVRLDGVVARRIRVQYTGTRGVGIEEAVLALRAGIIYELFLRTNPAAYTADRQQFDRIVAGFRFWQIHYC